MKTFLAVTYFVAFGFVFPAWVIKRSRGVVAMCAIAAPWVAFWMGFFAR